MLRKKSRVLVLAHKVSDAAAPGLHVHVQRIEGGDCLLLDIDALRVDRAFGTIVPPACFPLSRAKKVELY
jgi:hypothetical protein